ncbi:MAG: thioredoxin domain-containing protein [Nitrospirae bacterium]|nr:thioredoxin domain-containing protein [Nitrospirota bacterium]
MNRLSKESAPYLKHAADQKIDWYPWSEEAFDKARRENRPLFLSSGAVWCHWCHVMAEECFFDDDIARLLNENFVSIKLDRDERPDVDRRYQLAVAAMGSGGGWPLSVFMTPDGRPFFGGTYFPPEDRMGRPGFNKVLRAVLELYQTKRDDITQYTDKLMASLKNPHPRAGEIGESLLAEGMTNILSEFDPQNGGFGIAPKFPMPGALEFLMNRHFLTWDGPAGYAVSKTLEAMASGGFYDQLGGGFHRYSTDKSWIIPHFEKMADDNAWLLRNYLNAYSIFGDRLFREVAEGTFCFVRAVLSDPEGGFYASQDADVVPGDEGGYFTWTDEDFRKGLSEYEYRILSLHLIDEAGAMLHDGSKRVLYPAMTAREIAEKTGGDAAEIASIIKGGKEKLTAERNRRQSPFIDRTFYTSINGMMISVFLLGHRRLGDIALRDFALKSLERIMKLRLSGDRLCHAGGVKALLDDYAYLVDALIAAYEATGDKTFLQDAEKLAGICIEKLWDKDEGGFFDSEDHVLEMKIKGIEDIPHPSANALCVILLLKLYCVTGNNGYRQYAEKSLKAFSPRAGALGIHAGYYFCALDAYFNSLSLTLHTPPTGPLAETALFAYHPYVSIAYGEDRGCVIPCVRDVCYEPVSEPEKLREFLDKERDHGKIRRA